MIVPDCKEWKDTCDSKMSTLEYNFFWFWVQCILLFKHLLSFGLSEHKQNCKIVNAVYQGQFVLTHYLSRTFKQLWRSINKWWATARKTVTNMFVKSCLPRPRVVAKGYLQKRTSDFSSFSPTASQVTLRVILALTAGWLVLKAGTWMPRVLL